MILLEDFYEVTKYMKNNNIDYALVEEKRPPIYTAMKYWGKKPHNIWNRYISNYTPKNGIFLDPFSGSGMSAFESFKSGRKAIALDLNPLTSFIIETISSEFNYNEFKKAADAIIDKVENNPIYHEIFMYKKKYNNFTIQNVKWDCDKIYEVCLQNHEGKNRMCLLPDEDDYEHLQFIESIKIDKKYPNNYFRESVSFTRTFLSNVGTKFSDLYTKRNLWVLSEIFNEILTINEENIKKQLLFAFIQTVHLSTKMCVPRSKKTNRDFSTSWGRSAFLYSKKQMEMNPLLLFESNCFGKQSAGSSLKYANTYFTRKPIIADITRIPFDLQKNVDIWYGVVDVKNIDKYVPNNVVDFILTDPPYGGLVQYLDLSMVWLSWLELFDSKYTPNYKEEITVNLDSSQDDFKKSFSNGLKKLNSVLKDNGKLVLTFNNQDLQTWSSFLNAISSSNFEIEKVIHQQNKRTGESNVSDPYGTSASDFYIRCIKNNEKEKELIKYNSLELEQIIINKIIEIINERKEPTPYQILFNGLLAKLSSSKIDIGNFDSNVKRIMNDHLGKELCIYKNAINKAGNFWWINLKEFDDNSPLTLTNRVNEYVKTVLNKDIKISTNNVLQKIFQKFPNGLTPDLKIVYEILNDNAIYVKDYWIKR